MFLPNCSIAVFLPYTVLNKISVTFLSKSLKYNDKRQVVFEVLSLKIHFYKFLEEYHILFPVLMSDCFNMSLLLHVFLLLPLNFQRLGFI